MFHMGDSPTEEDASALGPYGALVHRSAQLPPFDASGTVHMGLLSDCAQFNKKRGAKMQYASG